MLTIPPKIIFFHGTSFESLDKILRSGLLTNSSFSVNEQRFNLSMKRRFGLNIEGFGTCSDDTVNFSQEGAYKLAREYARAKAAFDYCGSFCPDSVYFHGSSQLREHHDNIIDFKGGLIEKLFEELQKWNTEERAREIFDKASLLQGVVIGFDESLIEDPNEVEYCEFHIKYPISQNSSIPPTNIKFIDSQNSNIIRPGDLTPAQKSFAFN